MQTSKNVGIKQSIIPEFISGSSTQAVTQEQQPALKTLNKFQGLSDFITAPGFTLIEVLVVVLIIGILAAIALPMYNRAVLRSRFNALMPIVKAMNDSNEAYYLEHGSYASNPQDLPVQGLSSYPTGTELEFGNNMDYAYVLATNASAKNNYIMYQKHSTNYPGEIHCEAITGDDLAEYICVSSGGTTNLGTTLTEGYTTYVLSGSGAGVPTGTFEEAEDEADPMSCDKAIEMGLTCVADEENRTKKVCATDSLYSYQKYCRTKTYNEDGSYTSLTCQAYSDGVCVGTRYFTTYDANGNQLTVRSCISVDSSGTCTAYNNNGYDYTYDANGNMLSQRYCSSFDSSGNCTAYWNTGNYDYTYDASGNKLTERACSSFNSSGTCTAYNASSSYDYTYDADGNRLTYRRCASVDSSTGNCTSYTSYSFGYTYDANGNILSERYCSSVDSSTGSCTAYRNDSAYDYTYDANGNRLTQRYCSGGLDSSGNCTVYSSGADYTYDANGNQLTYRYCSSSNMDSSGNCTEYSVGQDYTYDANGNKLTQRNCSSVDSSGNCTAYSSGYNYTYDANGNKLTALACSSVDSSENCTAYSRAVYYTYDDAGKLITEQDCYTNQMNTTTGECTAYNINSTRPN